MSRAGGLRASAIWLSARARPAGLPRQSNQICQVKSKLLQINILMISVARKGMGIPLMWMLLPTAGNSNTSERTDLLDRLRVAFPNMKIAAPMGDREFIGDA